MSSRVLEVGFEASMTASVSQELVRNFVALSGDNAPLHTDSAFAIANGFEDTLVHGALVMSLLSRFVGIVLPGPASLWVKCDVNFRLPCYAPCNLLFHGVVTQVSEATSVVLLSTTVTDSRDRQVVKAKTMHKVLDVAAQ